MSLKFPLYCSHTDINTLGNQSYTSILMLFNYAQIVYSVDTGILFFFFASCFLWSQWCHSKKIDSVMSGSSWSLKTGGWGWWGNKSETVLTIRILTFSGAFQSKLLPRSHKKTTLGTFPLPFFQSFVERRGGGGNAPFPSPQFHSD